MRITAGEFRGRRLPSPTHEAVRPTPSKVREALFNMLGNIDGWHVLDLFAGSGLMALEAISRGATAVSVEQARANVRAMQAIRASWGVGERWQIVHGTLPEALSALDDEAFDLVYADPPYGQGIAARIPAWLDAHGIRAKQIVIEEAAHVGPAWPEGWTPARSRRYGDTCLHFLVPEGHP